MSPGLTSQTVGGIPTNNGAIYVRPLDSAEWQYHGYTYTAASVLAISSMSSPTPGTTLTGSTATFMWTANTGESSTPRRKNGVAYHVAAQAHQNA